MTTAVDTNALLAILSEDEHTAASEESLRSAYRAGRVAITPIVYAELAADGHVETTTELDRFLEDFSIDSSSRHGPTLRGGSGLPVCTDRRPDGLQCPSCGANQAINCEECGEAFLRDSTSRPTSSSVGTRVPTPIR